MSVLLQLLCYSNSTWWGLSTQFAGALALFAAAFSSRQVERAGARLPTTACILVVVVEAAGRRGAREARG